MQFKKGVNERRVPEFEHIEPAPEMDRPMGMSEQQRSPFSFSRGTASSMPNDLQDDIRMPVQPEESPVTQSTSPASRVESLVDGAATFDGHFRAEQDLRIQGTISGEITCRGLLTIERTASARARIDAHDLELHGTIEGDVTCSGRLHLASTAVISGTVKAGSLVVEEGASINGTVEANFSGEGGVSSPVRRRTPARKSDEESEAGDARSSASSEDSARKPRGRDLPSFALVSSEEPAPGYTRGASSS